MEEPKKRRFNEARALSTGKSTVIPLCQGFFSGFNEARALSTGKSQSPRGNIGRRKCFNEARALSTGKNSAAIVPEGMRIASMRPAH